MGAHHPWAVRSDGCLQVIHFWDGSFTLTLGPGHEQRAVFYRVLYAGQLHSAQSLAETAFLHPLLIHSHPLNLV